MILPGFHTAAESGVRKGTANGNDVFLSLCGLMSNGAQTVLISRWRTAGQTSFDLVREFAQELPSLSPAEAWQRGVAVVSDAPLEADREPRIKDAALTTARRKTDHPFFWAGYMLVDSGGAPTIKGMSLAIPGKGPAAAPAAGPRPAGPQPAGPQPAGPVPNALGPQSVVGDSVPRIPGGSGAPPAGPSGARQSLSGPRARLEANCGAR